MPKTWFVTGTARGIGAEIVKAALNAGDRVVATGRDPRKIEQTFRSDRLLALPLDVTKEDQVKASVDAAVKKFGTIDVLVNNAGYGQLGVFEETSPEQIRAQFETNVFGLSSRSCASSGVAASSTSHLSPGSGEHSEPPPITPASSRSKAFRRLSRRNCLHLEYM